MSSNKINRETRETTAIDELDGCSFERRGSIKLHNIYSWVQHLYLKKLPAAIKFMKRFDKERSCMSLTPRRKDSMTNTTALTMLQIISE